MVFIPIASAQPSSLSISCGSKVSACHISSWLMASEGMKLLPTSQGCFGYHSLAFSGDQRDFCALVSQRRDKQTECEESLYQESSTLEDRLNRLPLTVTYEPLRRTYTYRVRAGATPAYHARQNSFLLMSNTAGNDRNLLRSVDLRVRHREFHLEGRDLRLRFCRGLEAQLVLVLQAAAQVIEERREGDRIADSLPVRLSSRHLGDLIEQALTGIVLVGSAVISALIVPVDRIDDQTGTDRIVDGRLQVRILGIEAQIVWIDAIGDHDHLAAIVVIGRGPLLGQIREAEVRAGAAARRSGGQVEAFEGPSLIRGEWLRKDSCPFCM